MAIWDVARNLVRQGVPLELDDGSAGGVPGSGARGVPLVLPGLDEFLFTLGLAEQKHIRKAVGK